MCRPNYCERDFVTDIEIEDPRFVDETEIEKLKIFLLSNLTEFSVCEKEVKKVGRIYRFFVPQENEVCLTIVAPDNLPLEHRCKLFDKIDDLLDEFLYPVLARQSC
jgi:hypothetical protein